MCIVIIFHNIFHRISSVVQTVNNQCIQQKTIFMLVMFQLLVFYFPMGESLIHLESILPLMGRNIDSYDNIYNLA